MSFTTTFTVDQTPAAITDPRGWWSEEIEGGTREVPEAVAS